MSRARNVAGLVCALGLTAWHTADAQGRQPRYEDGCTAKWSDEVEGVPRVVKCRTDSRDHFLRDLAAPPLPSGIREFIVDPLTLTTSEHRPSLRRQGVRIHVINLNPYIYQYKISLKQTPVVET